MPAHNKMTEEEREARRQLTNARQTAVRHAWKEEKERVEEGKGTRNWSVEEQKELLETGRVSGYEGHHMKSVSEFPEEAGNSKNIQFLTEDEHLNGAHEGSYHNATNGYYNPNTGEVEEFSDNELTPAPEINLTESYTENLDNEEDYMGTAGTDEVESVESNSSEEYMGTVAEDSISEASEEGQSSEQSYGVE